MKIKHFSKLAVALALTSSLVLFEGCKKYDDDINRLEQSISQNTSDIASVKTQLTSLGASNVIESITSITGGFSITFKKADGTTFTHNIISGTNGTNGTSGTNGKDGVSPVFTIGANGNWFVAQNGASPVDTGVKASGTNGTNGKDGVNGTDGQKVEIKTVGSKQHWFINGQDTGVIAYAGDIAATQVNGGYNIVFTNSNGSQTESIFLATEAIAVSSLTLVPTLTSNNVPVVFFPRIVDNNTNRETLLQGYGSLTYSLNPFGVATENYAPTGLLTESADKVSFRSTGSGGTVNSGFKIVNTDKTFGNITVNYRPSGSNSLFPKNSDVSNLFIALQVENKKIAENQKFVASSFSLAKEEIVEKDEITIEKATKESKVGTNNTKATSIFKLAGVNPSFNGASFVEAAAADQATSLTYAAAIAKTSAHYTLHIKEQAEKNIDNIASYKADKYVLNTDLRGFFARTQVNNQIVAMDDNGLAGYGLHFSLAAPNTTEANWLNVDPTTGKLTVREATPGHYNTAALNNFTIVKIDLRENANVASNLIATRYVKVNYTQTAAAAINVSGTINHTISAGSVIKDIVWPNPLTSMDIAYSTSGKSAQDFHTVYSFTKDPSTPAGFDFVDMNTSTQVTARKITIDQSIVNPGTYTLKGTYKSATPTKATDFQWLFLF